MGKGTKKALKLNLSGPDSESTCVPLRDICKSPSSQENQIMICKKVHASGPFLPVGNYNSKMWKFSSHFCFDQQFSKDQLFPFVKQMLWKVGSPIETELRKLNGGQEGH